MGGNWKREVVPDHKFDFVDTRDFSDHSCGMRMKYLWLYITVFISFLVYISDIFTAVTMLTSTTWSNEIYNSCSQSDHNGCVYIPFEIGKWLFFGCIVFSFLLLAYEAHKAKKIIASRDISYAFTNIMANHYYSLRSYDHFCFFSHISSSTKKSDDFAFFVFFTFKGWKRVIFAEGPRQSINALTLYALFLSKGAHWYDVSTYFTGVSYISAALTVSTAFTTFIFALSLLMLLIAGICYIPLLTYIQGNLKEYCCHKVDKRIAEIIKRRNKQRLAKAAALAKKEAAGDYSHLKNRKGELIAKPLPQPTLPTVSLDDDDDKASMRSRGPPGSTISGNPYYFETKDAYSPSEYPPMPAFNPAYGHQYNQSVGTFEAPSPYEEEYGSTAHLTSSAAPFARAEPDRGGAATPFSQYGGDSPAESDYQHYQQQHHTADGAGYGGRMDNYTHQQESSPYYNDPQAQHPGAQHDAYTYDTQGYQNAPGYHEAQAYQETQAYQDAQSYQNMHGYQDAHGYQNTHGYQDGQAHHGVHPAGGYDYPAGQAM